MDRKEYQALIESELRRLFVGARKSDELSFLFAAIGFNSGEEDAGWQPIAETRSLIDDLVGLINGPLNDDAKTRIALLLYCHLIEANFLYHCLYNMLLAIAREPPKLFSFLDKYKNGVPPSVSSKVADIKARGKQHGFDQINKIFDEIMRPDIRNAFFHSDYILFEGELRLKHRGTQHARIPINEVFVLLGKTLDFFNIVMGLLHEARLSFPKGYKITGRKSANGGNLSTVDVVVDERGYAIGFSSSDPLPIW